MADSLTGKVVVVTGASAGVGRAVARAFGAQGCKLGLIARNEAALKNAAEEVRRAGGDALVLPLDVADAQAVEAAANRVVERFGRIDIWVNNAMVSVFSPVSQMKPEEYKRVTEVTYLGYVYGTLAALKHMTPRDEGLILLIGSALVYRSIPLQSAYCGAKAATRGFIDSLRTELIHDGSNIKISHVHLPAVNTPQFGWVRSRLPNHPQPVPPIYTPEMIARGVLWAARNTPREMVIASSALQAVWGEKFVPGLIDHYLASGGYDSQQTDEPVDPNRQDNLYEHVPGDAGAAGKFTDQSSDFSLQMLLRMNVPKLALAAVGGLVAAALAAGRR